MNAWDAAMQRLDEEYGFLSSEHLLVSYSGDKEQVCMQCMTDLMAFVPEASRSLCQHTVTRIFLTSD